MITSPANGAVLPFDATWTFTAVATDGQGGALTGASVVWASTRGTGSLGTGVNLSVTLPAGAQTVTCTATDSQGGTGTASVNVTALSPVAVINHPGTGETRAAALEVPFVGAGRSAVDGALTGAALVWTSDRDGPIGTGTTFNRVLTAGTHVITLTVTDSTTATATASVTLTMVAATTCIITAPAEGAQQAFDATWNLTATAFDSAGAPLTGASIVWTSSLATVALGTGSPLVRTLPAGAQTVTCTATASGGSTGSDSVDVISKSPVATILHPGDGENRAAGVGIPFSGVGSSAVDGALSGAALVWTDSLEGALGSGASFTRALVAGTHVVTLTVTDSTGGTATDSITLNVQ